MITKTPRLIVLTIAAVAALFVAFTVVWTPLWTLIAAVLVSLVVMFWCAQKRPHLLPKFVLLLISFCLTIVIIEFLGRRNLEQFLYYRDHERLVERYPALPLLLRYKTNSRILHESSGDLAAMSGEKRLQEHRKVLFVTDELGFRNIPHNMKPYDLVVAGDSYVVGIGTTQEKIWVNLLENQHGLHAYNLGMPGSPWVSYLNLCVTIDQLKLRAGSTILLTIFEGNDLDESYGPVRNLVDLPWNNPVSALRVKLSNFRKCSVIYQLYRRVSSSNRSTDNVLSKDFFGRKLLFFEPYAQNRNLSRKAILAHPNFPHLMETLNAIEDLSARRSLVLKIALMPSKEEVYSWVIDDASPWSTQANPSEFSMILQEFCRSRNLGYLDLKPVMIRASRDTFEKSKQLLWWADDTHWNPIGHEIAARSLYDGLLRR